MSKVNFKIDLEKDAYNYWQTIHHPEKWGKCWEVPINSKIRERICGTSWEKSKPFLSDFLKKVYKKNGKILKLILKQFSKIWHLFEKEYFRRLEKLTNKPIYTTKFTAHLTTCSRCPYNPKENSFMLKLLASSLEACQAVGHEIMHLQFHYYWEKDLLEKLGKTKFHNLKEALTVLLNEEFRDLWLVEDKGYPEHQELRKKLAEFWRKEKDFDKLVEFGVRILRKGKIK